MMINAIKRSVKFPIPTYFILRQLFYYLSSIILIDYGFYYDFFRALRFKYQLLGEFENKKKKEIKLIPICAFDTIWQIKHAHNTAIKSST